jgi:hypothetical protein
LNRFRTVSDGGFSEHDGKQSGCTKVKEGPDSVYNTRISRHDCNARVKVFNIRRSAAQSKYLHYMMLHCTDLRCSVHSLVLCP